MMNNFFAKMKGGAQIPPRMSMAEIFYSFLGGLLGIGICSSLSYLFFEPRDLVLIIGSMGASAVLVYGAIKSPFAQPRNLIGGHVVSGLVGVLSFQLFQGNVILASAVAVSLAIAVMAFTRTIHPPGGATALIAVIGGDKIHNLGFLYPFIPAGAGALVLLLIALITNNIVRNRKYPEYWF
jgi:CBS-domain-containing membrane protein